MTAWWLANRQAIWVGLVVFGLCWAVAAAADTFMGQPLT